jgi:hypothetical protein
MPQPPAAKRSRRRLSRRPRSALGPGRRRGGHAARRWRRGVAAIVALAVTALVVTATALAYWTTTGLGAAPATAADVQALTLGAATPSAQLYPGGTADVAVDVSNPNASAVHLGSLTLDSAQGTAGFDVDAGHAACNPSPLSYTTQSNGGAGWSVPPKVGATNGVLHLDLSNAVAMGASAGNACQGASFLVHLNIGS